ncbi:MAG: primosomal protein N' (replication factor Y) - superfamily II helicase [Planctomycetes bacterium]|nr:primosomal protein N' (replication factor Y) - superfamily II helicase [Planctomycetota bacterium]
MAADPKSGDAPPVVAGGVAPSPADAQTVAPAAHDAKERRFPCKGCGAGLIYKPGTDVVECPYCNFKETIPKTADAIREFSFNDYLAKPKKGLGVEGRDSQCQQCAAIIHLGGGVKSTRCPFCGTALVDLAGDAGDADVRPEAVAPFRVTARQAEDLFFKWVASLWFAPSLLKSEAQKTQVRGIYCPYWTYDTQTFSHYTGERGDYYYTTESYTEMVNGQSVTNTRQVRHTAWSYVSGQYEHFFDDVLAPGSGVELGLAYNVKSLVNYTPDFLAGFDAQRPSVTVENGWKWAREKVNSAIFGACRSLVGGDEQRNIQVQTAYRGITFKMVMLPVYVSSYQYNNKIYRFQVDGQSGKVSGQRPWSFWKIFGFIILMIAIAGGIALVAALVSHR